MFVILSLTILVAAFSIASALIMMVIGKTRDIAILKAMGATDKSIRRIFVFNGMVIGFIGTGLGLGLGLLSLHAVEMELALQRLPILRKWQVLRRAGKRLSTAAQGFKGCVPKE